MNIVSREEYDYLIENVENKKQYNFYYCFPFYFSKFEYQIDFSKIGNSYIQ